MAKLMLKIGQKSIFAHTSHTILARVKSIRFTTQGGSSSQENSVTKRRAKSNEICETSKQGESAAKYM